MTAGVPWHSSRNFLHDALHISSFFSQFFSSQKLEHMNDDLSFFFPSCFLHLHSCNHAWQTHIRIAGGPHLVGRAGHGKKNERSTQQPHVPHRTARAACKKGQTTDSCNPTQLQLSNQTMCIFFFFSGMLTLWTQLINACFWTFARRQYECFLWPPGPGYLKERKENCGDPYSGTDHTVYAIAFPGSIKSRAERQMSAPLPEPTPWA